MADELRPMARYEARIDITHLPGILDPQGATVEKALPALGYTNVSQVSVGKSIRLVVEADTRGRGAPPRSTRCATASSPTR